MTVSHAKADIGQISGERSAGLPIQNVRVAVACNATARAHDLWLLASVDVPYTASLVPERGPVGAK